MITGKTRSPISLYFVVLLILASIACKKDKSDSGSGSREDLIKDSVFLYAKEVYLWYDQLPSKSVFNPRRFTSQSKEIDNLKAELFAITRYGINPNTNRPFEFIADNSGRDAGYPKYSYITDEDDDNPVAVVARRRSSVDLEGNGYDFGLRVEAFGSNSNYKLYVLSVSPGSDAAKKGVQRGDYITQINGKTIGSNYNAEVDYLNDNLFDTDAVSLVLSKRTGGSKTISLNRTSYKSSPILKDTVYSASSKKIGYVVFNRFSNLNSSRDSLNAVFARFATKGVTDLIVDLRYNGGGYVSTAEHLMNLIAPSRLNGKIMYAEHFNKLMQTDKAEILKKQPLLDQDDKPRYRNGKLITYFDVDYTVEGNTEHFSKSGSLDNVGTVVFIVTGNTASASELVINSLKPHLNVKVVGVQTYGKPIGFFPVKIDKYNVYISMFESRNSKNEGGYFAGISPDTGNSFEDDDDPAFDFGDVKEASFGAAYSYIVNGSPFISSVKSAKTSASGSSKVLASYGKKLNNPGFTGMIQDRIKLK